MTFAKNGNASIMNGKNMITYQENISEESVPIKNGSFNNNKIEDIPTLTTSNKMEKKSIATMATESKKVMSTIQRFSMFAIGNNIQRNSSVDETNIYKSTMASRPACFATLSYLCEAPHVPVGTLTKKNKLREKGDSAILLTSHNVGNTCKANSSDKINQDESNRKFKTFGGRCRSSSSSLERFDQYDNEKGVADALKGDKEFYNLQSTQQYRQNYSSTCTCNELVVFEHFYKGNSNFYRNGYKSRKVLHAITRGFSKLWWKRSYSVDISVPDPEFKVSYLGNVLTGWAKGDDCVEKQVSTLWRNYTQNSKSDVFMHIKVCASGLKATTRQHGLTEYWANRITYCCASKNYPRVFCWIYRHEGRKLKHELRCHAVLCSKEKIVNYMCNTLKENLECALRDFKRDKILKQNARLSLANAAYDNPSLPRRKILLSVGGNNYRPPLERSKSAPKLMAIEEAVGQDYGDDVEDTNEPEMKSCCQRDSLYPAMTLARRRCRHGHSIRRTGKVEPIIYFEIKNNTIEVNDKCNDEYCLKKSRRNSNKTKEKENIISTQGNIGNEEWKKDEDIEKNRVYSLNNLSEFERILKLTDFETSTSFKNELLPFFDMHCLRELKDEYKDQLSMLQTIDNNTHSESVENLTFQQKIDHGTLNKSVVTMNNNTDIRQKAAVNKNSLTSDKDSTIGKCGSMELCTYRQKMQSSMPLDLSASISTMSTLDYNIQVSNNSQLDKEKFFTDFDGESLSEGLQSASAITTNRDDLSLTYRDTKYIGHILDEQQQRHNMSLGVPTTSIKEPDSESVDNVVINDDKICKGLESDLPKCYNNAITRSNSVISKIGVSDAISKSTVMNALTCDTLLPIAQYDQHNNAITRSNSVISKIGDSDAISKSTVMNALTCDTTTIAQYDQQNQLRVDYSDSECSDESGYVEYQGKDKKKKNSNAFNTIGNGCI